MAINIGKNINIMLPILFSRMSDIIAQHYDITLQFCLVIKQECYVCALIDIIYFILRNFY